MPDPQPPYDGFQVPERFRTVPFAELPPAIREKLAVREGFEPSGDNAPQP